MPLYEFRCRSCDHVFEVLVRSAVLPAHCPACGAADPERIHSLFKVDSSATRQGALASGRKHNKKQQLDKMVADREDIEHHRH